MNIYTHVSILIILLLMKLKPLREHSITSFVLKVWISDYNEVSTFAKYFLFYLWE